MRSVCPAIGMGSWRLHKCSKGFVWFARVFCLFLCFVFVLFSSEERNPIRLPAKCFQKSEDLLVTHPIYAGEISGYPLV